MGALRNRVITIFSAFMMGLLSIPAPALAGEKELSADTKDDDEKLCQQIGVNFWGASWHTQRPNRYNESGNWGLGVRCYTENPWFGNGEKSRSFAQIDAFRNSNWGIAVPISVGTEYEIMGIAGGDCQISAVGAVGLAFYESRVNRKNSIMIGPIPGISFGCRRVKFNVTAVPKVKVDKDLIVVAAVSMTFMLEDNSRSAKSSFLQVRLNKEKEEVLVHMIVPF
ncbi:MAG: hypothetical protein AAB355_03440 [Patescibacteria group bacterium]